MPRISTLKSSSTQLAATFTVVLAIAATLFAYELIADMNGTLAPIYFKVIVGIFLLVCVGLFVISYYVTKRINTIVATAEKVRQTGDLSARIPIDSHWDDLSKLSLTLNGMLQDIEQAVQGIRTISDNIAHDLRTPLTRLRNRMDDLRTTPPDPEHCHEAMNELIRECDAILSTFQALLRISNIENGKRYTNTKELSLSTVLHDVVELYEPLAADKGLTFHADIAPYTMIGDKDLLFQLFANLCDNAIKYTPVGGSVSISTAQCDMGVCVRICDTGPGIADDKKSQVFRRFFRVDSSRSTQGSGLGLSLANAVVGMHQGRIELHNNTPHGLCVHVLLPN